MIALISLDHHYTWFFENATKTLALVDRYSTERRSKKLSRWKISLAPSSWTVVFNYPRASIYNFSFAEDYVWSPRWRASIAQGSSSWESQTRRGRRPEDDGMLFFRLDDWSFYSRLGCASQYRHRSSSPGRCCPDPSPQHWQRQTSEFIEKRINSNSVGFWEPIPNMKIKTFSCANKMINAKSSDKLVTVNADRDLFGRLLIVSNTRQICLKDVLSFELSPVTYSLANAKSLRKGVKSVLCSILEKDVNVIQRLTASPNPIVVIIDGMAVIQMSKSAGASTFWGAFWKVLQHIHCPTFIQQLCASSHNLWSVLGEVH